MVKQRKEGIGHRNVRLSISTYDKLEKYLIELIQKRGNRFISFDKAIVSLIEDHYSERSRKGIK
jgi:hypothetical protein